MLKKVNIFDAHTGVMHLIQGHNHSFVFIHIYYIVEFLCQKNYKS